MPPRPATTTSGKATVMGNEAFLMLCFKAAKDRIQIDFNRVAAELGMSSGGAANKFRNMMKAMEAENPTLRSMDASPSPSTVKKPNSATGKKRKAARKSATESPVEANTDEDDNDMVTADSSTDESPTKKTKTRKGTARAAAKKYGATKQNAAKMKEDSADTTSDVEAADSGVSGVEDVAIKPETREDTKV